MDCHIKVSIIVAHYNTPDLCVKLLESIPAMEGWEVLVVDDNSTIDISELKAYAEANAHKKNIRFMKNNSAIKGAGASRNVAISLARGEWYLFADADDFFTTGFEQIVKKYENSFYDIVYFNPTSKNLLTGSLSSRHLAYKELVENYLKKPSDVRLIELKYGFCTPWSKMIRSNIFRENKLRFDEIPVSNDVVCMTKCAFYSSKIKVSNETIYCVTRSGQTLTTGRNEENFDIRVQTLIRRYTWLKERLSKKEFSASHVNRLALGRLADAVLEKWGIQKVIEILKLYHKNGICIFDIGLLNPFTFISKAWYEFKLWNEIHKCR